MASDLNFHDQQLIMPASQDQGDIMSPPQDNLSSHNQDNIVINLPVDVVHLIADFLTPASRALLSQTCRALRGTLRGRSDVSHLSRTRYLAYLVTLARGRPDQWVCEKCMTLHTITHFPTLESGGDELACFAAWPERLIGARQVHYQHRHVQLAIKLTRLQQHEYNPHLQTLLAPHYDKFFGMRHGVPLLAHYAVCPKVVVGDDGNLRFLLASTWRYFKGSRNISLRSLGYQMICPHLELNYVHGRKFRRGPFELMVELAIKEAGIAGKSRERTEACRHCATDYAVEVTESYLDLRAWSDFGSGGSPLDPFWQSQCSMLSGGKPNWRLCGMILNHEPGSVRELYGREGREIREETVEPEETVESEKTVESEETVEPSSKLSVRASRRKRFHPYSRH